MTSPTISLKKLGNRFQKASAKVSVNLRNVDFDQAAGCAQNIRPNIGDVLLARVTYVGDHKSLQSVGGRNVELYEGDKILIPYGNRYAVQQYEAFTPKGMKECHMVSKGGLASLIDTENSTLNDPTIIKPIGILTDKDGKAINTQDFGIKLSPYKERPRPITIAVFGTGMDAGKTTCAAELVKSISRTNRNAGFGKLTGTGAFSDIHKPEDAGAIASADFVDLGFPSTYKLGTDRILTMLDALTSYLSIEGADVNVIEIADGVFQSDNQKLLHSEQFRSKIDGVFVAADSGPAALSAIRELHKHGITVLGAGGIMTNTPLTVREFYDHIGDAQPKFGVFSPSDIRKRRTANQFIKYIEEQKLAKDIETRPAPEADARLEATR